MATQSMDSWCHRGTLYVEGNGTAEAGGSSATPAQIVTPTFVKGVEEGVTVDTTNSYITIAEAGDYLVGASVSFSGSNSSTYNITIYKDTSTSTNMTLERMLGSGGDVGSATLGPCVLTLAAGDDICLFQSSTDGGSVFTCSDAQLSVIRLS